MGAKIPRTFAGADPEGGWGVRILPQSLIVLHAVNK